MGRRSRQLLLALERVETPVAPEDKPKQHGFYLGAIHPREAAHFETVDFQGKRVLKVTYATGSIEFYQKDDNGSLIQMDLKY